MEFTGKVWGKIDDSDCCNDYMEVTDSSNESFTDSVDTLLREFEGKNIKITINIEEV